MKRKITAFALIMVLALSSIPAAAFDFHQFSIPINPINNNNNNKCIPTNPTNNNNTNKNNKLNNTAVSSYEQRVANLVNMERQRNGLKALALDNAISEVARTKSKDMATNNYFGHTSPTYGSAGDMLNKFGITWSAWGENIASGQKTPEEVMDAWMNSPSHRENILSPNFAFIGVGYYTDSNGKAYWTQMFTNDEK